MSTEERGGGGGGGGVVQGFASRQFGPPLKPLPPRMSRAEDDQGGLEPPPSAPAAAGLGSQAAAGSPPAPENGQEGLEPPPSAPAAAGLGSQAAAGSPPAPENGQEGLDPTAAAGGSSPAETSLVSSGAAEQEVEQRPTPSLSSRCCNFRFDDKKLWVCAAGVLLVVPLLLGIIYFFCSL